MSGKSLEIQEFIERDIGSIKGSQASFFEVNLVLALKVICR